MASVVRHCSGMLNRLTEALNDMYSVALRQKDHIERISAGWKAEKVAMNNDYNREISLAEKRIMDLQKKIDRLSSSTNLVVDPAQTTYKKAPEPNWWFKLWGHRTWESFDHRTPHQKFEIGGPHCDVEFCKVDKSGVVKKFQLCGKPRRHLDGQVEFYVFEKDLQATKDIIASAEEDVKILSKTVNNLKQLAGNVRKAASEEELMKVLVHTHTNFNLSRIKDAWQSVCEEVETYLGFGAKAEKVSYKQTINKAFLLLEAMQACNAIPQAGHVNEAAFHQFLHDVKAYRHMRDMVCKKSACRALLQSVGVLAGMAFIDDEKASTSIDACQTTVLPRQSGSSLGGGCAPNYTSNQPTDVPPAMKKLKLGLGGQNLGENEATKHVWSTKVEKVTKAGIVGHPVTMNTSAYHTGMTKAKTHSFFSDQKARFPKSRAELEELDLDEVCDGCFELDTGVGCVAE